MTTKTIMRSLCAFLFAAMISISAAAQVTTSDIAGTVADANGAVIKGASVTAIHIPSGSRSTAETNDEGRYTLTGVRVGGPYRITVAAPGFREQAIEDVNTSLGNISTVDFTMSVADANALVTVTSDEIFSEAKTGAATNVGNEVVSTLPTINRRLNEFAKLSPHYAGGPFGGSIAGQDNRYNNITVDGSYFNNSFGLSGQPGERTGVSPISLDAIQEFQINVAPYDVRQGNFTGAGINTVTKSGTNDFHGSFYYNFRHEGLQGYKTGNLLFNRGQLDYDMWGLTFGGPLFYPNFGENDGPMVKAARNKAFFFVSYENEQTSRPAHTFTACRPGQACGAGSVSRATAAQLDTLRNFLITNFGYDPGVYENYNFSIPADKLLVRGDWNIDNSNRLTLRYLQLNSLTDVPISTSNSGGTAGFGRGSQGLQFLSFSKSNYQIQENIRSLVGEWTKSFGSSAANSLLIGYTHQDESRPNTNPLFPMVEIHDGSAGALSASTALTVIGYEPFTPLNTLKYHSLQVQDNFSWFRGPHTLQFGGSFEKYHSLNIFFPSSQSVYAYRSLQNFIDDATAFKNNVPSPVTVARFNLRTINQPGVTIPEQLLDVKLFQFYGQDQWRMRDNFTLTFGLRAELPFFGETGLANPLSNALTYRDSDGSPLKLMTEQLPKTKVTWSPRVGFNWRPFSRDLLQIRGGTGFFSARPPYVWISNQIGNNGVLTSVQSLDATTIRRFNPNPLAYAPASVTGAPVPGQQALNFVVPDYRFPQIWRSSIAADYKLPFGLVAGAEFIYSKDIDGIQYINANLSAPNTAFSGADARPRWTGDTCAAVSGTQQRVNCDIIEAFTLKNNSAGKAWNMAITLEKTHSKGFYAKGGYAYGRSMNLVDASSTAGTSFNSVITRGNPNNPELSYSFGSMGHRVFASAGYNINYFKWGGTTISAFWESRQQGTGSWRYSNDLNGDTVSGNDALYIPKDMSEIVFLTQGAFTPAQQATAFEALIQQDSYLSKHRGEYALRNAAFFPMVHTLDLSVAQDLFVNFWGTRHKFQVRADILNFTNLLNKNWGGGYTAVSGGTGGFQPLAYAGSVDAQGRPQFRMNLVNGALPTTSFTRRNTSSNDVYGIQLGFRYQF